MNSQYVISVHNDAGCFSREGRLREYRDTPPSAAPSPEGNTTVLLRFEDREAVSPSAFCMVAVRASQAGVDRDQLRLRCGVWGLADREFVAWVESQGGELYRNDVPGVYFLSGAELREGTWCCQFEDCYGEGQYAFEAVAAALGDKPAPFARRRITERAVEVA